ncbi:hypothetical protein CUMW_028760 [Citrus unshiu]|nr:hypothetical protein CUMW_028760 [Citrus unshiu]
MHKVLHSGVAEEDSTSRWQLCLSEEEEANGIGPDWWEFQLPGLKDFKLGTLLKKFRDPKYSSIPSSYLNI